MLVLSRRPGDAILIDGGIRIVVLACDHRGVRIGIEAPTSIGIVREEIVSEERKPKDDTGAPNLSAARAWLTRKQKQG